MRTSVPGFSISGVMPLRVSCVKPCDSHTYSCVLPFSSTAGDVQVAVRVARLELDDLAGNADRLLDVEVRREAVVRVGRGGEQPEQQGR